MNLLLDTHTFLWWIFDSTRLSRKVYSLMKDPSNRLFFSAASGWEMAIKTSLGKLKIPQPLEKFLIGQLEENGCEVLSITLNHTLRVAKLPLRHRDPFDRLLVAQAQAEVMPLLTNDSQIRSYRVRTIW